MNTMTNHERFFERKRREAGVQLNKVQKQAVLHTEGPLLLLASPGSGKTTTLMMRTGYLIAEKGVNPARIKAVTFSRASARDMSERFALLFPELAGAKVGFSTIHSFAFEVVRAYYRARGEAYQLIEGEIEQEEEDELRAADLPVLHKKPILRQLYRTMTGGGNLTEDQMEDLTTYISYIKNKMLPEDRWSEAKCELKDADKLLRAYERYKREGTDRLLLDFDDMLSVCHLALSEDPRLLRRYQQRYDYLMTDESQDTSLVQFGIVGLLAASHGNLCVVADDDQSIYGWRGAEPGYLLDFKSHYPAAEVLKMERNYRSAPEIVETAARFIRRNKNRYDKAMYTKNPAGGRVSLRMLADYKAQAKYVTAALTGTPAGSPSGTTAVLYRNHTSALVLVNALDRAGIPFNLKDGDKRFFSHWVVEDVLNFMRMAYTDRRPELLEKIYPKLAGYITREQMGALLRIGGGTASVFDTLIERVPLKEYQVKQLRENKDTFGRMQAMNARQAIRTIRYNLGYERAIERLCERFGFRQEMLLGVLNTLEDIADGLDSMTDFAERLKYLETLLRSARSRSRDPEAVTLSTFHSAKGLEFDRVYMIDLAEGVIPSNDDIKKYDKGDAADMEEAVRLFYVGMTRAKRHLELVAYQKKDGAAIKESRFMTAVRSFGAATSEGAEGRTAAGSTGFGGAGRAAGHEGRAAYAGRIGLAGHAGAAGAPRGSSLPAGAGVAGRPAQTAVSAATAWQGELPAFLKPGAHVSHRTFGPGVVLSADAEAIRVSFAEGDKKLLTQVCMERGLLKPVKQRVT
ncbi:DNA helicase-2 / ATP-dependent DNA helicase PcrA [Cohnella sp. OV330]|uniref:ATP-dependent helicase n=1 Tax=Cohnella sp. OV330 TaxID=1855288 RepID=UPI0008E7CB03|nr:ATP-dependent helicase [Cohnella sp. OV330]SFB09299.1 DNA helicase-2 / ATP-dependent DNA helicase PcrA [Cohnella sp. OV330]